MNIIHPKSWHIPEREVTPEAIFMNRRALVKSMGFLGLGAVAAGALPRSVLAQEADPTANLYPAQRDDRFTVSRALTPEKDASTYNNFYEFGSHKRISDAAQALKIRPWSITIDGEVDNPQVIEFDDLVRKMQLEERVYRHRCVEAWAMTVPWTGFALSDLVKMAGPKAGAKFIRFETFEDPDVASGQRQFWYPWPYTEGLTIDEATNELAFMVTGIYGKPLPKQFGAPLRLAVPWKYGFKSIKSIVKISFVSEQPKTFWQTIAPSEYGFWANVNPNVPHPRWSQETEQLLGTNERVPTRLFNGYEEQVAGLYPDLKEKSLYL
ncbi:protein-methionine-sulfoxide reductase catalytic subunit MsrP [Rhodobacteraceae bacterium RKSG542]|uniref:protein-methionine-sulfoxide reductase catalytic subunit MsrP n=1 Tax=Pseudovibrio flavus TaxID=2529854 RepID=UPI0012BB6FE2|nr:protein-methionine-sulfoxide reductase catalytic subunit MsrP [Pseudovibrio flavus]MTI19067.1 protein-methionine-sulfoxide reductase catalytic subunit MsrP [Pseudovibrio flavus]